MAGKKLAVNVHVGGVWYGPSYDGEGAVPADVVKQVENPDVWAAEPKASEK